MAQLAYVSTSRELKVKHALVNNNNIIYGLI